MVKSQNTNYGAISSTVVNQPGPVAPDQIPQALPMSTTVPKDQVNEQADRDDTEQVYLDKLESIKAAEEVCHDAIDVLAQLARYYVSRQRYEDAVTRLEEARRLAERLYGGQHPVVAEVMVELAFVHFKMERFERACSYLEPAVVIYEQAYGRVSDQVAFTFHKLGRVHEAVNELTEAEKYYQKAVTTYQNTFSEDDSEMFVARNDLTRLQSKRK